MPISRHNGLSYMAQQDLKKAFKNGFSIIIEMPNSFTKQHQQLSKNHTSVRGVSEFSDSLGIEDNLIFIKSYIYNR